MLGILVGDWEQCDLTWINECLYMCKPCNKAFLAFRVFGGVGLEGFFSLFFS